jgi:hypothetical protein
LVPSPIPCVKVSIGAVQWARGGIVRIAAILRRWVETLVSCLRLGTGIDVNNVSVTVAYRRRPRKSAKDRR